MTEPLPPDDDLTGDQLLQIMLGNLYTLPGEEAAEICDRLICEMDSMIVNRFYIRRYDIETGSMS